MIKETLNESQFMDALRSDEYAGWSYGATKALYEYYEQLSEDIGEDIELDTVAIRCDFSEYDTCLEYANEFNDFEADAATTDDEVETEARKFLEERTTVLEAKTIDVKAEGFSYITSYVIANF